jgi:hypothetical protein
LPTGPSLIPHPSSPSRFLAGQEYKLLRIIDLSDVHSAAPVKHAKYASAFGIVTTRRTFYLKAADKAEADGWVADINAARRSP